MSSIVPHNTVTELQARIAQLERRLAQLERNRLAFDAPAPGITIEQRRRYEFAVQLARPRHTVGFEAINHTTGHVVKISDYTAAQIERAANKFARLFEPKRRHWRGDKTLYGLMLKLFAEHGAVVRDHGRVWAWAAWPAQRREIAAQIVSPLSRKSKGHTPLHTANA